MVCIPQNSPGVAGEGQLADDGVVAGPVEGHLAAAQEQAQGDRQVEPVGVLLQVGRSEVRERRGAGRSPIRVLVKAILA